MSMHRSPIELRTYKYLMSDYFKYLDLPLVPKDLEAEVYNSIRTNPNYFTYQESHVYKIHSANQKLKGFVRLIIPNAKIISVQTTRQFLPLHTDIGRTEVINYIVNSGGKNVYTCFCENNTIVEKINIEANRWHWLNVSVPHMVINLEDHNPRVSITVSV